MERLRRSASIIRDKKVGKSPRRNTNHTNNLRNEPTTQEESQGRAGEAVASLLVGIVSVHG